MISRWLATRKELNRLADRMTAMERELERLRRLTPDTTEEIPVPASPPRRLRARPWPQTRAWLEETDGGRRKPAKEAPIGRQS